MQTPSWRYDEFQHFGVDFANVEEVRAYDAKQGTTVEDEVALVETLGIAADDTVIEFGCGTGAFTVAAAQQCRHVMAVDISNAMLDFTAERAASYGLSNVTCCNAGFWLCIILNTTMAGSWSVDFKCNRLGELSN